MKLYLGEIAAYRKNIPVFLYIDEKRRTDARTDEILLGTKDLDSNWIEKLLTAASKAENNILYPDSENQYYMQLYLLFSLRRRLYYSDIETLSNMEYAAENLLYQKKVQSYLWKQLCTFMKKNGYRFKIIKSKPSLYEERPFVPFNRYRMSEFFCNSAVKMLFQVFKRLTIRLGLYFSTNISGKLHVTSTQKKLNTKYGDVKNIKSKSQSGCLFFSAVHANGKKLFIKAGTVHGADIENEYAICKLLQKNTSHDNLYLLPYMEESTPDKLVFPFVSGCSLKALISKRNLTADEVKRLLLFLDTVVTDLTNCHIVHRDIHFDNILCQMNSETGAIDHFLLSDFGCAVAQDIGAADSTLRQKRKNQYAGSFYRYARYTWDDAASSAYIIMQNIDADLIDREAESRLLSHIGENIYILK